MKTSVILGFYGESNTGKTSLIVHLIEKLVKRGNNIASIKITDKNISMDSQGKDSWKHRQAGAGLVVFSSPIETDYIFQGDQNISQIIKQIQEIKFYDIIFVEGARDKNIPKVRLGNIELRENTIMTYKDNFEELLDYIINEIKRRL